MILLFSILGSVVTILFGRNISTRSLDLIFSYLSSKTLDLDLFFFISFDLDQLFHLFFPFIPLAPI